MPGRTPGTVHNAPPPFGIGMWAFSAGPRRNMCIASVCPRRAAAAKALQFFESSCLHHLMNATTDLIRDNQVE